MEFPLVSILIPFKNTAAFLPECIQSVLEQEYTQWEVLAVDDHSTDHSWKLMEVYSLNDHRVRLLKNEGEGIIPALRTAYAHSQGQYVTRMDSDDIMPAKKIKVLLNALQLKGAGHLAVGKVRYFSIRGISDGYARYERWLNRLTQKGSNFTEIYKECPIPSPCWMVSRADLEACGAFTKDRYPEDYDLCFRFYEKKLVPVSSNEILHYWRDYDQRTSRTSEHYAQNYFLQIKLHYFLKLDRNPQVPLVVWGAGNKGKTIAASLRARNLAFTWVCDNPKKTGKSIYGVRLKHYSKLDQIPSYQSLITVANDHAQAAIREFMEERQLKPMHDYFFFC